MPNRIIKESICVSETIDRLSWFEEVLFYRLIVNCDDYGRFDGRIVVIKNRLFPLKDNLTARTVEAAINKLATVGLIFPYYVDGKPILQLPTWNDHQNVRAKRSKYPAPEIESKDIHLKADENICMQTQADVPVIQSNPYPYPYPNTESSLAPTRHKYGEYKNVLLSDQDLDKLKTEFATDWQERIERLSAYMASTGKSYKNHLATIRNWARKDKDRSVQPSAGKSKKTFNYTQRDDIDYDALERELAARPIKSKEE